MVSSSDFQDFTQGSSRLMQQLAGSPVASIAAGVNSVTLPVPDFARSLNLLITVPANVITLTVVGTTTGFPYLNAAPVYDGGIYYLPAMPIVDDHVTLTWYQVTATAVSIYVIASDEPISVSLFNPVAPTEATSERLLYGFPQLCAAGAVLNAHVTLDSSTKALRCAVDSPANVIWGKVIGDQSSKVYFDGFPTSASFPLTPIPIDTAIDTTVLVSVLTQALLTANLYVVAVNAPDFSGSIPITHPMTANELAPDPKQSEKPNQLPVVYDGTIAASGTVALVAAVADLQLRVHAIAIMQYTAIATAFDLEDTNGNRFFHYHYSAASNWIVVPLFGQLATRGSGLRMHNTTAVLSGAVAVTLWYSVL